jgi:hypothetical protein
MSQLVSLSDFWYFQMKNFRFSGKGFFSLAVMVGASSSSFALAALDVTAFWAQTLTSRCL